MQSSSSQPGRLRRGWNHLKDVMKEWFGKNERMNKLREEEEKARFEAQILADRAKEKRIAQEESLKTQEQARKLVKLEKQKEILEWKMLTQKLERQQMMEKFKKEQGE